MKVIIARWESEGSRVLRLGKGIGRDTRWKGSSLEDIVFSVTICPLDTLHTITAHKCLIFLKPTQHRCMGSRRMFFHVRMHC